MGSKSGIVPVLSGKSDAAQSKRSPVRGTKFNLGVPLDHISISQCPTLNRMPTPPVVFCVE